VKWATSELVKVGEAVAFGSAESPVPEKLIMKATAA